MRVSDDEIIDRLRAELSSWADEAPVSVPTLAMLGERSPLTPVELSSVPPFRRRNVWLVAAAAVLLVGVVVTVLVRRDPPATVVDVGPGPSDVTEISIGHRFGVRGLDVTDDAVWVTSHFDEQLYRIDPVTNQVVATFPIPSHVEGVRAVGESLWLSRYDPDEVVRVDPTTGAWGERIGFDSQPSLVTDGERLWAIADRNGTGTVVEIDPGTAAEIGEIPLDARPGFAAVDGDDLWVANMGGTTVSRVDLTAARVVAVIDVGGDPREVVAAAGSIWVGVNEGGAAQTGSIVRIDTASDRVIGSTTTGRFVHSLAAVGDQIWATNFLDGTVSVLDTSSGTVVVSTPIGNRPGGVRAGDGSVWLTPHRRNVVLRIDPTKPLEAAVDPDLARSVVLASGVSFIRCSGIGSPTVVLPGNKGEGAPWAVVEARLSRVTRVCAYEPIGVADPAELARPAADAATDLTTTLDTVGEVGPYVIVGEWADGLDAQVFAATHTTDVVGVLLVNGMSSDYLDRLRAALPSELIDRMGLGIGDGPEMQRLDESSRQAAAIGGLGDLPLVVLDGAPPDPVELAANSDPVLTVTQAEVISQVIATTGRGQIELSSSGRLVEVTGSLTPADIVDATLQLLG